MALYASNSGFFVGDSVINYGWDLPLTANLVEMFNFAQGGTGFLFGASPNITQSWNTNWPARDASVDFAIIQGGVNDIKSGSYSVAQVQAAFQAILDDATADVGADRVYVWNIAPWGNHINWTSTYQSMTEDYNSWLAGKAALGEFILIDMYDLLGDETNPEDLAAAYDLGDGIHPSADGVLVQYTAMRDALIANGTLNLVSQVTGLSMNMTKMSVGAVQPSTFNHVANDLRIDCGVVSNEYADSSILQDQTIGANYTWDRSGYGLVLLDRNLTTQEETDLQSSLQAKAGL